MTNPLDTRNRSRVTFNSYVIWLFENSQIINFKKLPGKALLHVSLSDPSPWQVSLVVAGGSLTKLAAPPRPRSPSCVYILSRHQHFLITTGQHNHTTIPSQFVSSQLIRYNWNSAVLMMRILSYFNKCKLLLTELASIDTLVFIQKHQLLIESPHQNKKRQAVLFLLFTQRAAPSSLTFKLHNSQLYSATYCHSHSHFWAYLAGRAGRAEAQCDHQLPTQNVDFQNDWLQQHNIQAGDCLVNSMWSSLLKL